jgi:hypothetical protein
LRVVVVVFVESCRVRRRGGWWKVYIWRIGEGEFATILWVLLLLIGILGLVVMRLSVVLSV